MDIHSTMPGEQVKPASDPLPVSTPAAPAPKKSFPWGWAGYGCLLIVLVVLVLIGGAANLYKYFPRLAHTTSSASNSQTISSLPFAFTAVNNLDSLSGPTLFSGMTDALGLNNDTDFQAPKHYTGVIGLDKGTSFSLGNGWCAKDETTLKQNLANLQYTFSINGTNVDLKNYPTLYFTDERGDSCAITGLNITPSPNVQGDYQIRVTQHFTKTIEDGISSSPYPAGDVTFDFTLRFMQPSEPGLSG